MTSGHTPILELRGVNKSFGAVQVLHDVNLSLYAGQVTALVGDNGAGKSTLVKCMAGIHGIDSGDYLFNGESVNLDIVQNMFLGREMKSGIVLDEGDMEKRAKETLGSLSVRTISSVRQLVSSLSGGQRQSVAIAKAVLWNSKVVMLDEPTAALGVAQTRQVLDLVRRLADNGLAVMLISHNMNDVKEVSDRVTPLYLGRVAADVAAKDVTTSQIIELITTGRTGDIGLSRNLTEASA